MLLHMPAPKPRTENECVGDKDGENAGGGNLAQLQTNPDLCEWGWVESDKCYRCPYCGVTYTVWPCDEVLYL